MTEDEKKIVAEMRTEMEATKEKLYKVMEAINTHKFIKQCCTGYRNGNRSQSDEDLWSIL